MTTHTREHYLERIHEHFWLHVSLWQIISEIVKWKRWDRKYIYLITEKRSYPRSTGIEKQSDDCLAFIYQIHRKWQQKN